MLPQWVTVTAFALGCGFVVCALVAWGSALYYAWILKFGEGFGTKTPSGKKVQRRLCVSVGDFVLFGDLAAACSAIATGK